MHVPQRCPDAGGKDDYVIWFSAQMAAANTTMNTRREKSWSTCVETSDTVYQVAATPPAIAARTTF